MSWSNGFVLMSEIIETLKMHVSDEETRHAIYRELIEVFESYDCDTLNECVDEDEAFASAYDEYISDHDIDVFEEDE